MLGAPSDASPQLMELGEPEAFGMLDPHARRLRHIDTDLDHGGGDEEPRFADREALHGTVFVRALHTAVHEIDHRAEALLQRGETFFRSGEIGIFGNLHQRTYPVDAGALGKCAPGSSGSLVE